MIIDRDHRAAIHQGSFDITPASPRPQPLHRQMILSTNFEEYEKGELPRISGESLFGTGIFLSDGMSLRPHRRNANRARH